jgi:hypothetical protein
MAEAHERVEHGLPALGKSRVDQSEQSLFGSVDWRGAPLDANEHGFHLRLGPEHRRTHPPQELGIRAIGHAKTDSSESIFTGRGDQPLTNFSLDHDQHRIHSTRLLKQVESYGYRDVVRKVRRHAPSSLPEEPLPTNTDGILPNHSHVRKIPGDFLERRNERPVDLQGKHLGSRLGERQCQRAKACPDLKDPIAGGSSGLPGDEPREIGIGQEVLAKRFSGTDPVSGGEILKGTPGQEPATTRVGP